MVDLDVARVGLAFVPLDPVLGTQQEGLSPGTEMSHGCFRPFVTKSRLSAHDPKAVIDATVRFVTEPCRPLQHDALVKAVAESTLVKPPTAGTISFVASYGVSIDIIRATLGGRITVPVSYQLPY